MKNLDFEWLSDEFMLYCRSIQLLKTSQPSLCTGSFDTKTHRLISVQEYVGVFFRYLLTSVICSALTSRHR